MFRSYFWNMSEIQHKNGRPTRAQRIQARRDIQPYFEKNVPAYKAAQITGYNVKTVNKHYKDLYNEIHGRETKSLVERVKNARIEGIINLDGLIRQSHEMLEDVNVSIQKLKDAGKVIPPNQVQSHSKIIQTISHLVEKKVSLMMLPDASDMINEEIKKRNCDRNA